MGSASSVNQIQSYENPLEQSSSSQILELFFNDTTILDTHARNRSKLFRSFKFIFDLNESEKILKSKSALNIFTYIYNLVQSNQFRDCLNDAELFKKYNLPELLSNLFKHCFKYFNDFLNHIQNLNYIPIENSESSNDIFYFIFYLTNLTWYYTEVSNMFRVKFHEHFGTNNLIKYLADRNLIEKCLRIKSNQTNINGNNLLELLIHSIYNLSKNSVEYRKDWEEINATLKIMKFIEQVKMYCNFQMLSYLTIANIISDEEIEMLANVDSVLKEIIKLISKIANSLSNEKVLKRIKIELNSYDKCEVAVGVYENIEFDLIELLNALNRIAVNDRMKSKIYKQYNLKQSLKDIIFEGNDLEKEHATQLLWQLCFDKQVCEDVYQDNDLINYLNDLNSQKNENQILTKNVIGIFWLNKIVADKLQFSSVRKKKLKKSKRKKSSLKNQDTDLNLSLDNTKSENDENINDFESVNILKSSQINEKKIIENSFNENLYESKREHIMISYNRESRDLCLKIKEELEKDGHKVWIDVESIHGSSLESMANAIENSKCVLMCMSEKYKQSPPCRAEAEYAFNIRRPIIPLIMQKNYIPDGWLGIILGSKIFINFAKYSFEECIRKLKNEIRNTFEISDQKDDITKIENYNLEVENENQKKNLNNWSNKDVQIWLSEKKFNTELIKCLNEFNGELLNQLNKVYKNSPEYFYSALSQQAKVDLHSIIYFLNEFEKLFI